MREAGQPKYLNYYKNPFEIRAELLSLAQNALQSQQDNALKLFTDLTLCAQKSTAYSTEQMEKIAARWLKPYTVDDVLEAATKLNTFVSAGK